MLTREEGREILAIAYNAMRAAVKRERFARPESDSERLQQPSGAFVTIHLNGELRGCIGYIESEEPLARIVAEVAAKAATEDQRFAPLTESECARASVEVSVLSSLRRIKNPQEIIIGKHGLVVSLGMRRGLLLPQVAMEHHLDRDQFLEAALRKAGLPKTMWQIPEIEIFVFEAEVLQEADVLH
jgi:AmmeMemoRadiSam system protein A